MNVEKHRELNKGNIKWRSSKGVQTLNHEVYKWLDEWKRINSELYTF